MTTEKAATRRDEALRDYHRKTVERRLRSLVDSPIGNRCVTCGHVKHNDLGYCQNGDCTCENGCTVAGLAGIVLRDLPLISPPGGGS